MGGAGDAGGRGTTTGYRAGVAEDGRHSPCQREVDTETDAQPRRHGDGAPLGSLPSRYSQSRAQGWSTLVALPPLLAPVRHGQAAVDPCGADVREVPAAGERVARKRPRGRRIRDPEAERGRPGRRYRLAPCVSRWRVWGIAELHLPGSPKAGADGIIGCDVNPAFAGSLASRPGVEAGRPTWTMLALKPDVAHVLTPPNVHFPWPRGSSRLALTCCLEPM